MDLNEMDYGELNDHIYDVIRKLRIKAYNEGYEQGKIDQRMDSAFKKVADITSGIGENFEKTSQEKRDEIVDRAKADIESLKSKGIDGNFYNVVDLMFLRFPNKCFAEFIVNKEKRTVVALLRGKNSNNIYARGIAKCDPSDCFNVHIGKAIALHRALGLEVPDEYLNAPQPTEKRIGDIVEYNGKAGKIMPCNSYNVFNRECAETSTMAIRGKIIDDSREGDE